MSHDQRPGRMRVVAQSPAERRRSAASAIAANGGAGTLQQPGRDGVAGASSANGSGIRFGLIGIFLLGCTAGGVAIAALFL